MIKRKGDAGLRHVTLALLRAARQMGRMYPSLIPSHRYVDLGVHIVGILGIAVLGTMLLSAAPLPLWPVGVYVLCAIASNIASQAYHFSPWHAQRKLLRRIDHAAIYLSICGTFTPILMTVGTPRALWILAASWAFAAIGIALKLVASEVKGRYSTASYLGLGLLSLIALPDVFAQSATAGWYILTGSAAYALGTVFYARKTMPFRYATWHAFVTLGGLLLYAAVWNAVVIP